jgi:hypothetical protein
VERNAAEEWPAERGHDVVEPEVWAGAFARLGLKSEDRGAFGRVGIHTGHVMDEGGADVVMVQPGVDDEVDTGSVVGRTNVETAGPGDVGEDLVELADMGWGTAQGCERQEKERSKRKGDAHEKGSGE